MNARRGVTAIAQRKDWDCGVAGLAMLLDLPYGDVAAAVRRLIETKHLHKIGLTIRDCECVGAELGYRLRRVYRQKDYLLGATGLLGLLGGKMSWAGHWVILKGGAIIDPSGGPDVWDALDYFRINKCRPCTLLVVDGKTKP